MGKQENTELFKQALVEGLNRRFDRGLANAKVDIDPTGAILTPGDPENCQGNGKDPRFEICCDECDHYLACFPEHRLH